MSDNLDPIANRIENVGMVPPVQVQPTQSSSLTEPDAQSGGLSYVLSQSQSQSGISESALKFSPETQDRLEAFDSIFYGCEENSVPPEVQEAIDID